MFTDHIEITDKSISTGFEQYHFSIRQCAARIMPPLLQTVVNLIQLLSGNTRIFILIDMLYLTLILLLFTLPGLIDMAREHYKYNRRYYRY